RIIFALGIPEVGQVMARDLARHFGSLQALQAEAVAYPQRLAGAGQKHPDNRAARERLMTAEGLQAVPGVGARVAGSIADFFAEPHNTDIIERLQAIGVHWPEVAVEQDKPLPLAGMTVVLTGTLSEMTRDEAGR